MDIVTVCLHYRSCDVSYELMHGVPRVLVKDVKQFFEEQRSATVCGILEIVEWHGTPYPMLADYLKEEEGMAQVHLREMQGPSFHDLISDLIEEEVALQMIAERIAAQQELISAIKVLRQKLAAHTI